MKYGVVSCRFVFNSIHVQKLGGDGPMCNNRACWRVNVQVL